MHVERAAGPTATGQEWDNDSNCNTLAHDIVLNRRWVQNQIHVHMYLYMVNYIAGREISGDASRDTYCLLQVKSK